MIGGIVGYGAYVPGYRISVQEIAQARSLDVKKIQSMLVVEEKAVPGKDEDAITIAVQAGKNALLRANIASSSIQAVYVGSESHPYAVKPSATIIGQALGIGTGYMAADMQFACKGGTAALQVGLGMVASGIAEYVLACGTDVAQAEPGDILEFTASAGGAAFVLGKNSDHCCVLVDETVSISSDTPDFWRRGLQPYPEHTGRFTAEPSYFYHTQQATQLLLERVGMQPREYDFVIFHQPNGKFPVAVAQKLGFVKKQYESGMLVKKIGNCYSASSLLGLTAVLDGAQAGQKILLVSYGSGSGSDAFSMTTTSLLASKQNKAPKTMYYVHQKTSLSYTQYKSHGAAL